ncbi:helix-turn-helix domain-containing protein [Colwellia piezophila]|uniref:helix-turn-helix domain-containing protein n=1 Tax=Colwellia piezophila TaxID=211668 RepID=UPI00146B0BF0|nr:AraC family transcriptional regulator [Colwellia piezophila]
MIPRSYVNRDFIVIDNPMLLALNISTLVVIIFSANLLILRSFDRQTYLPLAICLVAIGVLMCQPTLAVFSPSLQPTFMILSLPALLLISPCFWFYVQGLTAETPWRFSRKSLRHLIPAGVGTFIALLSIIIPADIIRALLVDGNDVILSSTPLLLRYLLYAMLITTLILILGWVIQSGFYFYKIIQRLNRYRRHLKDLFASTESREIKWLSWLLFVVGTVWVTMAVYIVLDNLFYSIQTDPILTNTVILVMLWSIAIWGLRQKPGFEELYESKDDIKAVLVQDDNLQRKYQRSALDQQQSALIATKIEKSMAEGELYLDASLSLQKLAKHIFTSPNYISQTLNETLGMNFFDYVNKYRVDAAKRMLKQSNNTVLDIAMSVGFNAKSSFYTAFKKETGQTPSQYRKHLKLNKIQATSFEDA